MNKLMKASVSSASIILGMMLVIMCTAFFPAHVLADCPNGPCLSNVTPSSAFPNTEITLTGSHLSGTAFVWFPIGQLGDNSMTWVPVDSASDNSVKFKDTSGYAPGTYRISVAPGSNTLPYTVLGSLPSNTCYDLNEGSGPDKIVFMRSDPAMTDREFLSTAYDAVSGYLSIDPFKSYANKLSFYVDTTLQNESALVTKDDIFYDGDNKYALSPDPSKVKNLSACGPDAWLYVFFSPHQLQVLSTSLPSGVSSPIYLYYAYSDGVGNGVIFTSPDDSDAGALPFAPTTVHEAGHAIGGLNDEYMKGTSYDLFAADGVTTLRNCSIAPSWDYRNKYDNRIYGSVYYLGCGFLKNGSTHAGDTFNNYYRPSADSLMSEGNTTDNTKFNVVSCGYVVAAILGESIADKTYAQVHWPAVDKDPKSNGTGCMAMVTAQDGLPPVNPAPKVSKVSTATLIPGDPIITGSGFNITPDNAVRLISVTNSSLIYNIDNLASPDGTTLSFTVPTTILSGQYSLEVGAFNTPWSAPITVTVPGTSLSVSVGGAANNGWISSNTGNISCTSGNDNYCSAVYPSSTAVTLTENQASASSPFLGWGGACSGSSPTCVVNVNGNQSVTASFAGNPQSAYKLSLGVNNGGNGSIGTSNISISGTYPGGAAVPTGTCSINNTGTCLSTYPSGTAVTLTAMSAAGSSFVRWNNGCSGFTLTCNVTLNSSETDVVATFKRDQSPNVSLSGLSISAVYIGDAADQVTSLMMPPVLGNSSVSGGCSSSIGFHWKLFISSPSSVTISSIVESNTTTGFLESWSTSLDNSIFPLIVFQNGVQLNKYYNQSFAVPIGTTVYDLYGQDCLKVPLSSNVLTVNFPDGTNVYTSPINSRATISNPSSVNGFPSMTVTLAGMGFPTSGSIQVRLQGSGATMSVPVKLSSATSMSFVTPPIPAGAYMLYIVDGSSNQLSNAVPFVVVPSEISISSVSLSPAPPYKLGASVKMTVTAANGFNLATTTKVSVQDSTGWGVKTTYAFKAGATNSLVVTLPVITKNQSPTTVLSVSVGDASATATLGAVQPNTTNVPAVINVSDSPVTPASSAVLTVSTVVPDQPASPANPITPTNTVPPAVSTPPVSSVPPASSSNAAQTTSNHNTSAAPSTSSTSSTSSSSTPSTASSQAAATSSSAPTITISLIDASSDKAGRFGVFGPGSGSQGLANDWHWQLTVTTSGPLTASSMTMADNNNYDLWSTSDSSHYPLVVYQNGSQQNASYGKTFHIQNGTTVYDLYGQIEGKTFDGAVFKISLSDGTMLTATVPGSSTILPPSVSSSAAVFMGAWNILERFFGVVR